MKVLKRNQLVILVIALMLVTAGYLNFTSMHNNEEASLTNSVNLADSGDGSIGDATLVNNNNVENETAETPINTEKDTDAKLVSTQEEKDYYFENSKLDRDKMYSQMLESYQKMYEGETVSIEQKTMAANEIAKINATRNAIMISENLIKTKGISDVVIFVNDTQISVVIDAEELATEQIAQIQNIVSREMKAQIENIHISCK